MRKIFLDKNLSFVDGNLPANLSHDTNTWSGLIERSQMLSTKFDDANTDEAVTSLFHKARLTAN